MKAKRIELNADDRQDARKVDATESFSTVFNGFASFHRPRKTATYFLMTRGALEMARSLHINSDHHKVGSRALSHRTESLYRRERLMGPVR